MKVNANFIDDIIRFPLEWSLMPSMLIRWPSSRGAEISQWFSAVDSLWRAVVPEVELCRAMLSRNCIVAYPLLALTDDAVVVINTSRRGEISRSAVVAEANCWALFIIQEFIPSIAWTRRVLMSLCRDGSVAEGSFGNGGGGGGGICRRSSSACGPSLVSWFEDELSALMLELERELLALNLLAVELSVCRICRTRSATVALSEAEIVGRVTRALGSLTLNWSELLDITCC